MKMIINDPRYRYTRLLALVQPIYISSCCWWWWGWWGPSDLHFSLSFVNKVPFPNWVRRNRRSMPTKSKRRRKKKRRPESNTRSPKRPFRGSWRTTRRWLLPRDTSKCCSDFVKSYLFFKIIYIYILICGSLYCQYNYAAGIRDRSAVAIMQFQPW